jgi:peptidoglycan-associated lipoprotein
MNLKTFPSRCRAGCRGPAGRLRVGVKLPTRTGRDAAPPTPVARRHRGPGPGAARPTGTPQSQVATVDLTKPARGTPSSRPGRAHRLLRLRQLRHQGRVQAVVEGHAKAMWPTSSAAWSSKAMPTSAAAANTTWPWARSAPRRWCKSLALLGVGQAQVEAVSFGEERPAVQGSDEAAWAKNRRAELKDR